MIDFSHVKIPPIHPTDSATRQLIQLRHNSQIWTYTNSTLHISDASTGFDTLLSLPLPFQPHTLLLNSPGSLAAVIGNSDAAIVRLPDLLIHKYNNPQKPLLRHIVPLPSARPVKCLWNPNSLYESELLILTDDSLISAFSLSADGSDLSARVFDFSRHETLDTDFHIVSIAFGCPETPSGPLTLFMLTREANIYAVNPFVGVKFAVEAHNLELLLDEAAVRADAEPTAGHLAQLAFWARIYDGTVSVPPRTELRNGRRFLHVTGGVPGSLQGPFRIAPFPESLDELVGADIASLAACDLLAVTTSDVSMLLFSEAVPMVWDGESGGVGGVGGVDLTSVANVAQTMSLIALKRGGGRVVAVSDFGFVVADKSGKLRLLKFRRGPEFQRLLLGGAAEDELVQSDEGISLESETDLCLEEMPLEFAEPLDGCVLLREAQQGGSGVVKESFVFLTGQRLISVDVRVSEGGENDGKPEKDGKDGTTNETSGTSSGTDAAIDRKLGPLVLPNANRLLAARIRDLLPVIEGKRFTLNAENLKTLQQVVDAVLDSVYQLDESAFRVYQEAGKKLAELHTQVLDVEGVVEEIKEREKEEKEEKEEEKEETSKNVIVGESKQGQKDNQKENEKNSLESLDSHTEQLASRINTLQRKLAHLSAPLSTKEQLLLGKLAATEQRLTEAEEALKTTESRFSQVKETIGNGPNGLNGLNSMNSRSRSVNTYFGKDWSRVKLLMSELAKAADKLKSLEAEFPV